MKVVVIGASGLVGNALLSRLLDKGHEALGCCHSHPRSGVSFSLDVTDRQAVDAWFQQTRPQAAFLCVNTSGGVDRCEREPELAHRLNVLGTENVSHAARQCGTQLVYYSTDYVFDGAAGPYGEEDEPRPISVYGNTKLLAEGIVQSLPRHLIVRTTAVFGWDRGTRNFAMQVWNALSAGHSLSAPSDQLCNPTWSPYLAECSIELMERGVTGVVNIVGQDRVSRFALGRALAEAMEFDPSLVVPVLTSELGQTAARPLQGGLKTDKLQRLLPTPPLALAEALRLYAQSCRQEHRQNFIVRSG